MCTWCVEEKIGLFWHFGNMGGKGGCWERKGHQDVMIGPAGGGVMGVEGLGRLVMKKKKGMKDSSVDPFLFWLKSFPQILGGNMRRMLRGNNARKETTCHNMRLVLMMMTLWDIILGLCDCLYDIGSLGEVEWWGKPCARGKNYKGSVVSVCVFFPCACFFQPHQMRLVGRILVNLIVIECDICNNVCCRWGGLLGNGKGKWWHQVQPIFPNPPRNKSS